MKLYKTKKEAKVKENEVLIPVYKRYKETKVIDRCCECGHKTGSHIEKRPIGEPSGYHKREKTGQDIFREYFERQLASRWEERSPSELFPRLKGGKGKTVKFKRYERLTK